MWKTLTNPQTVHTPSTLTRLAKPFFFVISFSLAAFEAASGSGAMAESFTISAWGCSNSAAIEQHLNREREGRCRDQKCGPNCIYYIFHIQENSLVRCDASITNCFPNRRYRTPSGLKIYIHTQKPAYIKSLRKKCMYLSTCRLSTLYLWRHMSDDGRIAPRHSQQSI